METSNRPRIRVTVLLIGFCGLLDRGTMEAGPLPFTGDRSVTAMLQGYCDYACSLVHGAGVVDAALLPCPN